MFVFFLFVNLLIFSQNNLFFWESFGPNASEIISYKNTGRTLDIQFVNNNKILLLASSTSGIWRSLDSGKTWTCTSENLPGGVNNIAYDEKNNLIFIDFSIYLNGLYNNGHYSYGVFVSDDFGETWQATSLTFEPSERTNVADIKISNDKKQIIYVLTNNSLLKSNDLGTTWKDIFLDTENELLEMSVLDNNDLIIAGENCLYVSVNKGRKWENVLPDSLQIKSKVSVTAFENTFWASVYNYKKPSENVVIKSNNSGKTLFVADHNLNIRFFVNEIIAFSDSIVFVGGKGLNLSVDGGETFQRINGNFHQDVRHVFLPDTTNLDKIYVSTDGGLFYTKNRKNFKIVSKMSLFQLFSVAVSQQDSFLLLAGAHDNGTLQKDLNGEWKHVLGGDGGGVFVNDSNSFKVAYASKRLAVFNANINRWAYKGFKNQHLGLNPMQNPVYGNIVYAATYSNKNQKGAVLRSINSGSSFVENNYTSYGIGFISAIEAVNDSVETIFYASSTIWGNNALAFYKSSFSQDTLLTERLLFLKTVAPLKIVDIFIENKTVDIYIVFDGFIADQKIWHSSNNGQTWDNLTFNLPNIPTNTVFYFDDLGKLLIGNDWGVYVLEGDEWEQFGENLPYVPVTGIDYNYAIKKLFISTYGRGIWTMKF